MVKAGKQEGTEKKGPAAHLAAIVSGLPNNKRHFGRSLRFASRPVTTIIGGDRVSYRCGALVCRGFVVEFLPRSNGGIMGRVIGGGPVDDGSRGVWVPVERLTKL